LKRSFYSRCIIFLLKLNSKKIGKQSPLGLTPGLQVQKLCFKNICAKKIISLDVGEIDIWQKNFARETFFSPKKYKKEEKLKRFSQISNLLRTLSFENLFPFHLLNRKR